MGNDEELQELGAKLLGPRQPRDTLVKLLKTLSSLLVHVDQSAPNDTHSALNPCKDALVKPELLKHKDKEVRLLVATCASEIMRIEAPEIPYDDEILKELFNLIVTTFKGLDDMDNPSFSKRVSILETVASIKSCVLMLDLEVGDLVLEMFRTFFARARDDHPSNVLKTMAEIMTLVLDESDDPEGGSTRTSGGIRDLLNEILQHLVPGKKVTPAAQKLAADVISRTSKMQDQLVPHVRSLLALVFEKNAPPWVDESHDQLIYKLYQCNADILVQLSPDVLQLLKSEDGKVRLAAVNLLGKIFSHPTSKIVDSCLHLVVELGKRCADMSNEVRLAAIEAVRTVLMANPSLQDNKDLLGGLDQRLLDLDPAVRIKAVSAICGVFQAYLKAPASIVENVGMRLRDKKPTVRNVALQQLAQVYSAYCSHSPANLGEVHQFECIPGKILKCFAEFKPQVLETTFTGSLFAPDLPVEERAKHWVLLFYSFEGSSLHFLDKVLELKDKFQREMRNYLAISQKLKEDESPELEKKQQNHLKAMSMTFIDANKVEEDFQKLHSVKDNNVFKAIATLLNVNTSHADARAATDDLLKIVAKSSQVEFYKMLATRCSYLMFGREHVKSVFKALDEVKSSGKKEMVSACLALLVLFAGPFPSLMEGAEQELLALIKDGEDDIVKEGAVHILSKSGQCLRDNLADQKSSVLLTLEKLSIEGTRNQAKYAVPAIASLSTDSGIKALSVLYGHLLDNLQSRRHLGTVLQSLGCIAQIAVPVFETREADMLKFILEDLLRRESPQDAAEASKLDWSSKSEECVVKIYGLKALVKSCLPNRDAHMRKKEKLKDMFPILLKLLQSGSISDEIKSSDVDRAHLRLASAKAVLRLARTWDKEIPPDVFHCTVMTALDPFLEVRQKFLHKTQKYLKSRHLPSKYATVFALCAADAVRDVVNEAKRFMADYVERERYRQQPSEGVQHLPEYVLTYLVHVLAHQPNFPDASSADAAAYEPLFRQLHLFLNGLFESEKKDDNVLPMVLQIFSTIKRTQDAIDDSKSQNLYVLCDIGVQIAKKLGKRSSDDPAPTVPLPTAFFRHAGEANIKEGKDNHLPDCLTEEVLSKFHELLTVKPSQPAGRGQKRSKKTGEDSSGEADEDEDDNPPPKKARGGDTSDKKPSTKPRVAKKMSDDDVDDAPPKRKRGRPPSKDDQGKQKKVEAKAEQGTTEETPPAPKRKPGRPKGSSKKAKMEKVDDSPATSAEAKAETSTKQSGRKSAEKDHRTPRESEADKSEEEPEETRPPKRRKKEKAADKPASASKNGTAEDIEAKEALIGRKVAVWWPLDKKYYKGTIVGYNPKTEKHKVHYVDGDRENLVMSEEKYHFTDEAKQGGNSTTPTIDHGKSKKKSSTKEDEPQGSSQKTKSSLRTKKKNRDSEDGHHESETKVNGSYKRPEGEAVEAESSPQPAASVAMESGSEEETLESYRRRKRKASIAPATT